MFKKLSRIRRFNWTNPMGNDLATVKKVDWICLVQGLDISSNSLQSPAKGPDMSYGLENLGASDMSRKRLWNPAILAGHVSGRLGY
jgi:hypothetical protein